MSDATGTPETFTVTVNSQQEGAGVAKQLTTHSHTITTNQRTATAGGTLESFIERVLTSNLHTEAAEGEHFTVTMQHFYAADFGSFGTFYDIDNDSARWEEQVSETGSGSVTVANAVFDMFAEGSLLTFYIGTEPAWTMLIEDFEHIDATGTIGKQETTITGRGHACVFEEALIYPTLGYDSYPIQVDMYYDWRHQDYDDSSWVTPSVMMSMSDAQTAGAPDWGNSAFLVWSPNFPAGPSPFPDPSILWAPGSSYLDAPVGTCYFRQWVTLPWTGTYVMWLAADNRAVAYMDGVAIGQTNTSGTSPDTSGWIDTQSPIWFKATAGTHLLAIEAENTTRSDTTPGNPAGVAWNAFIPGFPVTLAMCMFSSQDSGIVMSAYPPEPPGMTAGHAVRLAIEEAQNYGDIPQITWDFDDFVDSSGAAWTTTNSGIDGEATISTKILTDILTFLREVSASYCDWRLDPTSWTLHMYNHGTMNRTDYGIRFVRYENAEELRQRGTFKLANTLVGVTQFGYLEVEDSTSVGLYGRKVARLEIGSVDNPYEAIRVLIKALEVFANPRDEISVQIAEPPYGYLHYKLGELATTTDRLHNEVVERIVAIGVTQTATGRARTIPVLKDIFLA